MRAPRHRFRPWLELVRPPNLPTVPGDPVAGAFLAAAHPPAALPVAAAAAAATLLYAAGLLLNDWADRDRDLRERPDRPLPSGRVRARAVPAAAAALAVAGLLCAALAGPAALAAAFVLLAAVLAYDLFTHNRAWAGVINMGLCRGLSVWLGAAAAGGALSARAAAAAAATALYIMAVTALARRETVDGHPGAAAAWTPAAIFGGGLLLAARAGGAANPVYWPVAAAGLACQLHAAWQLRGHAPAALIQKSVGARIRALLFLQAAFCAAAGHPGATAAAVILAACVPVSALLARRWKAS
jgi:4-hydroxybenzoate polyprenyltransferase